MCLLLMHCADDKPVLLRGSGFLCKRVAGQAYRVLCDKECNSCDSFIHQKNACESEDSFMRRCRASPANLLQKEDSAKSICGVAESSTRRVA